jgi:hypothetical protein
MPIGKRNRKRESSPTNERPSKRQRTNNDLRNNVLAAYAASVSPRKSRRGLVNPDPMAELGGDPAEPQGVEGDGWSVQMEEDEVSVSRSRAIITSHKKRTYGGKGRARAVHRATANTILASPRNIEEVDRVIELSILRNGSPRQNPRGNLTIEGTHEGAQDEALARSPHSKELQKDQHPTRNAENASRQSRPTRRGRVSDAPATREPEDPAISPNNSSKANLPSFSPALIATDQISPIGVQSDPDEIDAGSAQSVELPPSQERRRGRPPKKSKVAPEEDSPSKEPILASQPTTSEYQRDGLSSKDEGEYVLQLYAGQSIYPQVSIRSQE